MKKYDLLVIGGGIFGLYAALQASKRGMKVGVIEKDQTLFSRASLLNQSRLHNGYHYPRSMETAIKAATYYNRFCNDFHFAINNKFRHFYGVSSTGSKVSSNDFQKFCREVNIPLLPVDAENVFKAGAVEDAFEVTEYSFNPELIGRFLVEQVTSSGLIEVQLATRILAVEVLKDCYWCHLSNEVVVEATKVVNATYASTNEVNQMFGVAEIELMYELCEIVLCKTSTSFSSKGVTIIDGPFFSLIPFGGNGLHSLSSVVHTPHKVSHELLPAFDYQDGVLCSSRDLSNCNKCPNKPKSSWEQMFETARSYLDNDLSIGYESSLYAIKAILKNSEIDDARPTFIRKHHKDPAYYTVLSGKLNTIYEVDKIID